jgi:hypothetical protein
MYEEESANFHFSVSGSLPFCFLAPLNAVPSLFRQMLATGMVNIVVS